ncbi:MAG: carboxypeptidase-like regulatory domain-containing protein, partial [Planctomycetota bacterium]|nr:carboxypeptidase-like regulatory domain-containing protein [Planctomycetota bacterium]
LHPLKTIRCQFLDGGDPLVGAEVELLAGLLDPTSPSDQRHLLKEDDSALWMRTDQHGRIEWTAFSNPDYQYRLLARSTKNTAVEHWFTLQDTTGPVVDLGELTLTTSGSLLARVQTPEGMTPAGLTLLLDNVQSTVMGQCDKSGQFTLHGLPPGTHRLYLAEHAGFRSPAGPFPFEVYPDATTDLQVDLRPFALEDSKLQLMHEGFPLAQHKVFLLPDSSGPMDKAVQKDLGYLGMTDDEGRVQGERPPHDWVQVWAVSTSTPTVKWKGTRRVQLTGNGDPSVSVQMKQVP